MAKQDKSPGRQQDPETHESQSQADGTAAEDPRGATDTAQVQSSGVGPTGIDPGTTGNRTKLGKDNPVPAAKSGQMNPSAPTESTESPNIGPGRHATPKNANYDSAGADIGNPDADGTMSANPADMQAAELPSIDKRKREDATHDEGEQSEGTGGYGGPNPTTKKPESERAKRPEEKRDVA